MINWLRERWKVVLGSILGLLGVLSIYLRSKNQKAVLAKANESHRKDNEINQKAIEKISEGFEEIDKEKSRKVEKAEKEFSEKLSKLSDEKESFVKESSKNSDLAKELAKEIGAEFVENKK